MKSIEKKEERMKMVDMHDYFINHITDAMKKKNYIEANWLIYACLENRYFRILCKYKGSCKYSGGSCRKNDNKLALSTKIDCVKRLHEHNVACVSEAFDITLFEKTKKWVNKHNKLMHNLLSLSTYKSSYETKFKEEAEKGLEILTETYTSCTKFREKFFADDYQFAFPNECMELCKCNTSQLKQEEKTK